MHLGVASQETALDSQSSRLGHFSTNPHRIELPGRIVLNVIKRDSIDTLDGSTICFEGLIDLTLNLRWPFAGAEIRNLFVRYHTLGSPTSDRFRTLPA